MYVTKGKNKFVISTDHELIIRSASPKRIKGLAV